MTTTRVISVGGSLIAPTAGAVDTEFLKGFRQAILEHLEAQAEARLILVCGGGAPAREYQRAYREVLEGSSPAEADAQDWIGIAATCLNAELVRQLFGPLCPEKVVTDPTALSVFPGRVLVAAGWKPGFSTDHDAVLLAERFQAEELINLSNVPKVYSADPRRDPSARPLDRLRWSQLQELVGSRWQPGINAPFDPVATRQAARLRLTLIVADGGNIPNLRSLLAGEIFEGTVIGPD